MLKNFLTMMLMLGSALLPLLGAAEYQTALAKATERKPLVLFCYGANYDKVSADLRERFVRKREIMRYARGAVFLEVPIYQLPNEK